MKIVVLAVALLIACPAYAQEGRLASDWRREREKIAENCGEMKKLASCAVTLVTDYPFHVALGNLAPKNGFGFGLAFVERYTPNEDWRISFNADAVTSTSASWRTGGYVTFVRTKVSAPTVSTGPAAAPSNPIREYPVFRVYAQRSVLKHLVDFGPDFDRPIERNFGETQTIAGGSAVLPINAAALRSIGLSVIGGIQGRLISIHDSADGANFTELFEDVRIKPSVFDGRLRLNYSGRLQQFLGDSDVAFRRWTLDLRHEIPLYTKTASTGPREFNGPDDCGSAPTSATCPELTLSRNLNGAIHLRLLALSSSASNDGGAVPFYMQPTLGGSDINNQRVLAAFDDYRFRAPHLIAMQASIEHSIWGPLGGFLAAERGKAVQDRDELNFNAMRNSVSAGFTLRAGGAPVVTAGYAWGGGNNRFVVTMDSSLLGGWSRPSLH
jgi:hypothetical protein